MLSEISKGSAWRRSARGRAGSARGWRSKWKREAKHESGKIGVERWRQWSSVIKHQVFMRKFQPRLIRGRYHIMKPTFLRQLRQIIMCGDINLRDGSARAAPSKHVSDHSHHHSARQSILTKSIRKSIAHQAKASETSNAGDTNHSHLKQKAYGQHRGRGSATNNPQWRQRGEIS